MRIERQDMMRMRKKETMQPEKPATVVMMLSTNGFDSPAIRKKYSD